MKEAKDKDAGHPTTGRESKGEDQQKQGRARAEGNSDAGVR
jgi:hypothetical protein